VQAIEERPCYHPHATCDGANDVVSPPPIEKEQILRGQKDCSHENIPKIVGLPCERINAGTHKQWCQYPRLIKQVYYSREHGPNSTRQAKEATPEERRSAGLSWRSGRDAKKAKRSNAGGAPAPNKPPSTPAAPPDAMHDEEADRIVGYWWSECLCDMSRDLVRRVDWRYGQSVSAT
jgi:hypothetical protein